MTATTTRHRTVARMLRPAPPSPHRRQRWLLIAAAGLLLVVLAPVVLLAGAGNPPCTTTSTGTRSGVGAITGVTPGATGHFTAPLHLSPGRWYRVGATEYGGDWGASPTQSFLPAYPNTFAELSTLDANPANGGLFTFTDADALGNLPYLTGLRVAVSGWEMVLYKRDIGYGQGPQGQGPGSLIYRIDVWQTAAQKLAITKTPVSIQLAPADGTAPTLGQLPAQPTTTTTGCAPAAGAPTATLPALNSSSEVQIGADGIASAPADAPRAVKLAVAAANQISDKPYPVPDVHYDADDLTMPWPAYDCSATVSYVLYHAGLRGATATDSTGLETYGLAGPGRWISVYANSAHTWIVIAGRAFDTSHYGGLDTPTGTGPRWEPDPTANLADNNSYIVRHPAGL